MYLLKNFEVVNFVDFDMLGREKGELSFLYFHERLARKTKRNETMRIEACSTLVEPHYIA